MSRMTYLQRRAGAYKFRYRLPDELAGKPVPPSWPSKLAPFVNGKSGRLKHEIIRSLGTIDLKIANRAVIGCIAEAQGLIADALKFLKDGPASEIAVEVVEALARNHEISIMRADESVRRQGIGLNVMRDIVRLIEPGMTRDDIGVYRVTIAYLDQEVRDGLARMKTPERIKFIATAKLSERSIVPHPDDSGWAALELALLQAEVRAFAAITKRLDGEEVATPKPIAKTGGLTLTAAWKRWSEGGGQVSRKPVSRSSDEAKAAVDRFLELHGDLAITSITKAHAREFRDAMSKIPTRLPHKMQKMKLPLLMKQNLGKLPPRSAVTVNKILALLSGVVARAEREGHFDALTHWSNPFAVSIEISKLDAGNYQPFTTAELTKLFKSPVYADHARPIGGKGEAAYWLPLIALYSGARRTEIAQLRVSDIRKSDDGIDYFDFTAGHETQRVKTLSSRRVVPIHPALLTVGLLAFAEQRKVEAGQDAPLWLELAPPVEPKAAAFSKWFGHYTNRYVVDDPTRVFHSFRHTFKRACREAGISEEIHNAFTGHAGGGVGRSYGRSSLDDGLLDRGISLRRLVDEIARVAYPLQIPSPPANTLDDQKRMIYRK